MSRPAKFTHDQILDITARLAAATGPGQATIASIAGALQAPTGSIYHRFASRDVLLGEVWLRAAERFQEGFIALLAAPSPWDAGLAAALYVPARARREPVEARILLLHRREDFLAAGWPQEMAAHAAALKQDAESAIRTFSKRLLGRADAEALRGIGYALASAPLAAILPHLRAHETPPASADLLVRTTYAAVMALLGVVPPSGATGPGEA